MNSGRMRLWGAFWFGVVLVVAALGWASSRVYLLEERGAVSRAMNQRQELIRLALWRMDSRLAPMIALEAARPIEDYQRVLTSDDTKRSYDDVQRRDEDLKALGVSDSAQSEELAPKESELLNAGAYAQGFFEIDSSGRASGSGERVRVIGELAAQNDQRTMDAIVESVKDDADDVDRAKRTNADMKAEEPALDYRARQEIANLAQSNRSMSQSTPARSSGNDVTEQVPVISESLFRESLSKHSDSAQREEPVASSAFSGSTQDPETIERADAGVVGSIEPRWVVGDGGQRELVLVRTIERNGAEVVQGVWLDWDAMSAELIGSIGDLLPTSQLVPIVDGQVVGDWKKVPVSYRLATVPVAFIPGGAMAVEGDSLTPAMMAMLVTWVAVIGAMIAVGLVLRTVLNLSARRGRFVGAVTHELRTPLTTFRLYSQMLADGMVTDEGVRKEYLNTLKRESDRLTGIVENVLEYARLSRQVGTRQRSGKDKPKGEQRLTVGELMARIVPPMSRLGEQGGMDLVVSDETGSHAERTVTLDPHAVERIVMNLMDNACKYAGSAAESDEDPDLRVHLDASVEGDTLVLVVADHGPGVPGRDRRKIFGEFVRGSSGTMRDRSGLGLGLALSRGLAVEMGGDLSLVRRRGHGAEFELRVPLDEIVSVLS